MPIYEYYCPDNHTIYQFFAKTLAQGQATPRCPDNPRFRMQKVVSAFAITRGGTQAETSVANAVGSAPESAEDARMDAAMASMENEFSSIDENDPKAMARIMRKMSELSGEKIDGQFEEVVRKLEEGADPESLEDQLGGEEKSEDSGDPLGGGMGLDPGMPAAKGAPDPKESRHRYKTRQIAPRRDPKLYDYE
jgi:hypothetical protein